MAENRTERIRIGDIEASMHPTAIFRKIAVVGDSLSSGELVSVGANGAYGYHDYFEYSWGQFIARELGATVYNFSRGGMTAKEYTDGYADAMRMWDPARAAQCYLVALGVNDLLNLRMPVGSVADICPDDPEKNQPTFAGYYAKIIQRYRAMQPRAPFFLLTMPSEGDADPVAEDIRAQMAALLYALADYFSDTYVIDLYRDGPVYDQAFRDLYMMNGHMTPAGYLFSAKLILRLWDRILFAHPEKFHDVGFVGTDLYS